MIHASAELVEAMRGAAPPSVTGPGYAACAPAADGYLAFSYIYDEVSGDHFAEDHDVVTCPACLALMAEARGPERTAALAIRADELEERAARIDYLLLNAGPPGSPTGIAVLAQVELERRRDYCRRSIAAIRSAVPVVPGVAEETAA